MIYKSGPVFICLRLTSSHSLSTIRNPLLEGGFKLSNWTGVKIETQKLDKTKRVIGISTACDFKQTQNLLKVYFYAKIFSL